jgi:hypothetical protein
MADHKSDIDQWSDAIDLGIQFKEKYGESKRWDTYRKYYRGIFTGYKNSVNGLLPYNLTYSTARTLIPNIYFRNPYVNITPRWKLGRQQVPLDIHAKVVESTDNWLLQEMSVKQEMKTGLLDCYFTNRAIWKIGYDSQYGFSPAHLDKTLGDATLTGYDAKGNAIEYNPNIKPGMPWVLRVNPDDFVVPFGARTLDDCEWCAHRVLRPLADVKLDKKYKNTKDLEGTHLEKLNKDPRMAFYQEMSKNTPWVEIFEVRNRKTREVFAFVPGHDFYIREPEEDVLQVEGLPYVDLTFNEDVEYYWGPSDCTLLEPQQLEVNEARTQAMLHRRIALVKFIVESTGIDDTEIDKMMSENVGPVVKVKNKASEVISLIQPHIPAELITWVDQIRSDVRELVGFSRQDMGESPPGRRTATEMRMTKGGGAIRINERQDMVADALTSIVRKTNQTCFSRWSTQRLVQVVGYDGAKYWVAYKGNDVAAEYNEKVDVESMTPIDKQSKRKEIVELIGALGNNPRVNIDYLMRMLLREFDYLDAMAVLPEAPESSGGQPMQMPQYQALQQQLLTNPDLRAGRVKRNQAEVGSGK